VTFQGPDDPREWEAIASAFLRRHVEASGAKGVVVGLSGGLDSAVVATLAARSLGPERVLGVILPASESDPADREDALLLAQHLSVETVERPVGSAVAAVLEAVGKVGRHVRANATSRLRMVLLYAEAQRRDFLVCGTANKSELLTGYFTKWGDGATDLSPIGDLYKTQVFALGRHLGVPQRILDRKPSAGLHPGQTDEGDMGVSYEDLDRILKGFELNQGVDEVVRRTGLAKDLVERVDRMVRRSEHKRRLPLAPKVGARTVGHDWRRPVQVD